MHRTNRCLSSFISALLLGVTLQTSTVSVYSAERTQFSLAWSIYVGWMPWDYIDKSGIMKKWADKYGIQVDIVQINDYIESINQYTAGKFDSCVMTNMDALTIPAAGGVDSTALIVGDFSNGNDGIVLKNPAKTLPDIKGQQVNLVELSVSHYLLARALDSVKLSEKDIKVVNTADADIVSAWSAADISTVVTWNPQLSAVKSAPNATLVFDSSRIPGEIIDLLVVNSQVLKESPKLGKALAGAWYEAMQIMSTNDEAGKRARESMAKASATDLAGFDSQLNTTRMFYRAQDAVKFARSEDLPRTMDYIRKFAFDHGLLGEGAKTIDAVGMSFPGGKLIGNPKNIKLRYDDSVMALAADNQL